MIDNDDSFCQNCGQPAPAPGPAYTPSLADAEQAEPAVVAEPAVAAVAVVPGPGGSPSWGASGAGLPAAAEAGPNATYMGQRLLYEKDPEPSFDPLGNPRFLAQMGYRGLLYWLVYFAGAVVGAVICALVALIISVSAATVLYTIGAVVVGLTLLICYWVLKIPIKLSEWKLSVDGKAAAAPEVLDHIAWVLRGRATPLTSLEVRRLHPPGGETVKDYLELRSTIFYGYVACFPYGTDLYVGWTFWVRLSPFWYLCMAIMRIWQSLTNRGNDLYTSLRFDTARALREVMHSAAREGTDVAVGRLQGQGRGIVGTAIRVTESAG